MSDHDIIKGRHCLWIASSEAVRGFFQSWSAHLFYSYKDGKTVIDLKVTPKASKNGIRGVKNDKLLVTVTSVPENNKANIAVIELLSKKFGVAKSKFTIISGDKGRDKKICIDSTELAEVLSQIPILKD